MKRSTIVTSVATAAAGAALTLLWINAASTQTLPPPSTFRVVETLYASAGVATLGSNGSAAWFIETTPNKERNPIVCRETGGNVECKRGKFP